MKTSRLLIGLVALVPLTATAAFSAPSSIGPTGILNVPTAEAVPDGKSEIMLGYDRPHVAGVGINVLPIVNLEHGFGNGEIGVSYFGIRDHTAVKAINAKYIFAPERAKSPGLAVGAMYLKGNTAETDLYLVATDHLGRGDNFRATGGFLYQKPSHTSGSKFTEMVGLELGKPGKTTLGLDYVVKDIAAGSLFGATIRQPITQDLTWQIGLGNHSRFYTSLTLQFGGK